LRQIIGAYCPESRGDSSKAACPARNSETDATRVVFDPSVLRGVFSRDEDAARACAENYARHIESVLRDLVGSVSAGDLAATDRESHRLAGAAANVGGPALQEAAAALCGAARAGDHRGCAAGLDRIMIEASALLAAIPRIGTNG
jgi:HPt (histidine-containing phosphotransfer) domain-containing protein